METTVGDAVVAADGDLLMYSISDTTNFSVNNNGQISTKVELDYETQSEYTVTLTATDPSGASDTIMVNITVTDENDPARSPARRPSSMPRTARTRLRRSPRWTRTATISYGA